MSKFIKKTLSLLMATILAFTSLFSFSILVQAKTTAELQSEKSKIQSKIDDAQSKLDSISSDKKETQDYLNTLQSKITLLQDKINALEDDKAVLQSEIDAVQTKITKTENKITSIQESIDKEQAKFDATYATYCQRLRAMYVSGSASTLEVLMTCTDMSEVLTRAQMIKSVSKQDSATLDELMTEMEKIEAKKNELESKKVELQDDKKSLEDDKAELQSSINEIDSSKSELDSEAAEANALMEKLTTQESEYQELIDTNQEELESVENEIRAAAAKSSSGDGSISASTGSGSGVLSYPTYSHSISAGYPYYSSGGYHGGVDFPVPSGTAVCAAAAGTVILVKHLTYSYGNYIMIDHGNGLSTLYAHNTSICVSVGDHVSAGQQIAYSGSTGNSTGPHCHFEVRVNGSRVNPLSYL